MQVQLQRQRQRQHGNGKNNRRSFDCGGKCAAFAQDDNFVVVRKRTDNSNSNGNGKNKKQNGGPSLRSGLQDFSG
jgi:hypothetical protein